MASGDRRQTAPLSQAELTLLSQEIEEMRRWTNEAVARGFVREAWRDAHLDMRVRSHGRMTGAKFKLAKDWAIAANTRVLMSHGDETHDEAIRGIARTFETNVIRYAELSSQEDPNGRRAQQLAGLQSALGVDGREFQLIRSWYHDIRIKAVIYAERRPRPPAAEPPPARVFQWPPAETGDSGGSEI